MAFFQNLAILSSFFTPYFSLFFSLSLSLFLFVCIAIHAGGNGGSGGSSSAPPTPVHHYTARELVGSLQNQQQQQQQTASFGVGPRRGSSLHLLGGRVQQIQSEELGQQFLKQQQLQQQQQQQLEGGGIALFGGKGAVQFLRTKKYLQKWDILSGWHGTNLFMIIKFHSKQGENILVLFC
jgi:hypothetical protein